MASTNLDEKTTISEDINISGSPNVAPESLDDNYGLYKSTRDVELDPTEARKVLKKIDLRVLSILMVTYVLQYLDKNCVNIASVYGLKKDTHLKGQDYSWLKAYYSTIGIATMFSGLIGYAVGHVNTGLSKWQYIFLIFGAITISWGILILFLLPDSPSTTRFLSTRERAVAVERVAANRQGIKNRTFKMYQAKQMILDPKTWILFIMALSSQIPTAAVTSFASINIASFGFDTLGTQYMLIPGGAVQLFGMLLGGWVATRWPGTRCAVMVVANTICIIGSGLLVGLPADNKLNPKLIPTVGPPRCSLALLLPKPGFQHESHRDIFERSRLHKETAYSCSNIHRMVRRQYCGPQTFITEEAPGYHTAYLAMLIAYSIKLVMVFVLYIHMYMFNRKRDREQAATPFEEKEAIELGMHDATEFDNKGFRYIL
ncbi:Allantoate permease [Lachnellula hyalina]|uniref:Allantoate permease n=1 Tax=Lachnellula hyalina TaxID=1316788 RepID=A0A8H8U4M7_9HELO|nr:Allantoate permease [Lachnellula hyalina]TVY30373.1 Allantoate permease [Lachnellula hyalina]